MSKIRKGDIVGRKSYGKDIYFKVSKIIEKISTKEEIAILNGLIERIEADSPVSDLEIIPRRDVIKRLKEANINVIISSFQFKLNIGSYIAVKEFADKINSKLIIDSVFIENILKSNKDLRLNIEELKKLYLCYPENIYKSGFGNDFPDKNIICEAGYKLISINPNLDVLPCINYNYSLGNIKETSLTDIWNYNIPEFRKKLSFKKLIKCNKKSYCRYCKYCPAVTLYSNNFMRSSNSLCENSIAKDYAIKKIKEK